MLMGATTSSFGYPIYSFHPYINKISVIMSVYLSNNHLMYIKQLGFKDHFEICLKLVAISNFFQHFLNIYVLRPKNLADG